MDVYKLVKVDHEGRFRSAFFDPIVFNHYDHDVRSVYPDFEYKVGEKTLPLTENSRLFCFSDYKSAIQWSEPFADSHWYDYKLFYAKAEGIEKSALPYFVSPNNTNIQNFLENHYYYQGTEYPPTGTLAVKSLTLLRCIKSYESL